MRMKWWLLPVLLMLHVLTVQGFEELADDDFAEFETFPSDDDEVIKPKEILDDFDDDNIVIKTEDEEFATSEDIVEDETIEDDDNEFEHFQDTEEFEGYQDSAPPRAAEPDLKINKVPITVRQRWDAYWLEGVLCCLLAAYALVYAIGRARNTTIALDFLTQQRQLLEENFTLVGEGGGDVVAAAEGERGWRREAEHVFSLWCSGRLGCEGVLITLRLNKRQDLVHVLINVARPSADTLLVRAELPRDDADPCVLCVGQRKVVSRMAKEMQDLSVFCGDRRASERPGLPPSLCVVAECAETAALLDARACAALAQCAGRVHYVHISDRYAGVKQAEEQAATKPPETERVLLASFAAAGDARPLLLLVLHLIDRVKRHRLSKEALAKCEKRRQRVAEAWQRGAHAARQELAAARREEKRKQEKERILAEDDPEKQRKWELKEQKRQQKRKSFKMKQLKVKAL